MELDSRALVLFAKGMEYSAQRVSIAEESRYAIFEH